MNHVYELTPRDPAADTFQGDVIREVKILGEERDVPATSQPPPASTIGADELCSDKERAAPSAGDVELVDLVSGNSAFAFDLYKALGETDGNLFYSPYSISLALAMTYAGARGETETQMADTLHYLLSQDKLHPTFNALDLELASRAGEVQAKDDKGFRLNIANAVWGQDDYDFLEPFLEVLAESYGAGVRPMDFREAPEASRVSINDWGCRADGGPDQRPDSTRCHRLLHTDGAHQRNLLQRGMAVPLRREVHTHAFLPPTGRRRG